MLTQVLIYDATNQPITTVSGDYVVVNQDATPGRAQMDMTDRQRVNRTVKAPHPRLRTRI